MGIDEIKTVIKALSVEDRRKVALYLLELEKEHVQATIGPQIAEDIEGVSKAVHEGIEKLKKVIGKT
jgi:hypothetical protein